MGRITTLLTIWIAGFMVGFVGWYIYPQLSSVLSLFTPLVLSIFDAQITNAAIAGFTINESLFESNVIIGDVKIFDVAGLDERIPFIGQEKK